MIKTWITQGTCEDPLGEFFVALDFRVHKDDIWSLRDSIRDEMIPSFISKDLAMKVAAL